MGNTALLVACDDGRENFDCNRAIKLGVIGTVDLTHAAFTEFRADLVTTEFCAWLD